MVQPYSADEVVLSDTFADAHRFEPGDRLAAIINGKRKTLTIVGVAVSPEYVYQIAPGAMFPDFKRYGVLWMGRNALAAAYDMEGAFNNTTATLARGAHAQDVLDRMDTVLGSYGGTGAIGFGVVYNSARIALSERGRELASLRVLGFTQGEIAYILLGELAVLTLAAIPVGMLVGVGLVGILVLAFESDLYRLPLALNPSNYALGATVVIVSALISGLLIWRQLGKLDLVAVLKTRE